MLVDIFSIFDDYCEISSFGLSLNGLLWMLSLSVMLLLNSKLWVANASSFVILNMLKSVIIGQVFRSFGFYLGWFANLIIALFLFLILMNLMGLVPYVFSSTSHLVVSFSLGFPLWFALILSGCFNNVSSFVASFVPMGAPSLLNPFLVVVETVSICVRSITLAVRLIANMSAGHIVLALVGTYLMSSIFLSFSSFVILMSIQIGYTIFEFAISLIQAYIFCLLITLYSDDHPH